MHTLACRCRRVQTRRTACCTQPANSVPLGSQGYGSAPRCRRSQRSSVASNARQQDAVVPLIHGKGYGGSFNQLMARPASNCVGKAPLQRTPLIPGDLEVTRQPHQCVQRSLGPPDGARLFGMSCVSSSVAPRWVAVAVRILRFANLALLNGRLHEARSELASPPLPAHFSYKDVFSASRPPIAQPTLLPPLGA